MDLGDETPEFCVRGGVLGLGLSPLVVVAGSGQFKDRPQSRDAVFFEVIEDGPQAGRRVVSVAKEAVASRRICRSTVRSAFSFFSRLNSERSFSRSDPGVRSRAFTFWITCTQFPRFVSLLVRSRATSAIDLSVVNTSWMDLDRNSSGYFE